MNVKIKWQPEINDEGTNEFATVGTSTVGRVRYSWLEYLLKKTPASYLAFCFLPDCKSELGRFSRMEAARAAVEKHIQDWFAKVEEETDLDQPDASYIVCLLDADIYESLTPPSDQHNPRPKVKAFPVRCSHCGQETVLLSFVASEEVGIETGGDCGCRAYEDQEERNRGETTKA